MNLSPPKKLDKRLPGIAIGAETESHLKELSLKYGISVSELVRRSIALFLSEIATANSNFDNSGSEEKVS